MLPIFMTVYQELWNSPDFISKRIKEQRDYIIELKDRTCYSSERKQELFWSAVHVLCNLMKQQQFLDGNK